MAVSGAAQVVGGAAQDAAIEDLEARELVMQARIQTLAEDNDLLRRENELNNGWVENQQGLAEALDSLDIENQELKDKILQLEAALKPNPQEDDAPTKLVECCAKTDAEPRMHFNQGSVNTFFNVKSAPAPEDTS